MCITTEIAHDRSESEVCSKGDVGRVFFGKAQCDPQGLESVRDGKVQLLFTSLESLLSNPQMARHASYRTATVYLTRTCVVN